MFEKRKSEINRRKAEIRELLEKGVDADGNAINIDNITEELRQRSTPSFQTLTAGRQHSARHAKHQAQSLIRS